MTVKSDKSKSHREFVKNGGTAVQGAALKGIRGLQGIRRSLNQRGDAAAESADATLRSVT